MSEAGTLPQKRMTSPTISFACFPYISAVQGFPGMAEKSVYSTAHFQAWRHISSVFVRSEPGQSPASGIPAYLQNRCHSVMGRSSWRQRL